MLSELHRLKGVFGYTKSGCEGPPGWAYTIGLSEMSGHPELVVVGLDEAESAEVLDAAAARVVAGGRLAAGGSLRLMGHDFGVVAVHPRHWDNSTFAVWHDYYEEYGPAPESSALQLLSPPEFFCACHANLQRRYRLDRQATDLPSMTCPRHRRSMAKPRSRRR